MNEYINKTRYTGVIPPLITPLTEEHELDREAMARLIEYQITNGVSGVFVMGSSGEAMMVSQTVWADAIRATVELVRGRCHVFCGVIDASTIRVIENIKRAEDLGAAIMVVTPSMYFPDVSQGEILRHYETIAKGTKSSIVMYNIPGMTHSAIAPETARFIAQMDNVVAIKDSSGDYGYFQQLMIQLVDCDIAVFNGDEPLNLTAMLCGAQGCVPALGNIFPGLFVALFEACRSGDLARACALQKESADLREILMLGSRWVTGLKYLASKIGLCNNTISRPLEPICEEIMQRSDMALTEYMSAKSPTESPRQSTRQGGLS